MARFTLHIEVEDDSLRQALEPLLASLGAMSGLSATTGVVPPPKRDVSSSRVEHTGVAEVNGEGCEVYFSEPYTLRVSRTKGRARILDADGCEIGLTDGQQKFLCALTRASRDCPLTYESDKECGAYRSRSAFDKMRKSMCAVAPELELARPARGTGFFLKHLERR